MKLKGKAKELFEQKHDFLKECCKAWNVDTSNNSEVKERCSIVEREWSDLKEVHIDGYIVAYFSDWKTDVFVEDSKKIGASFKVSKILTPKDFNIGKNQSTRESSRNNKQ